MEITYLGHSCFRIRGRDASILTDPFSPKYGINMGRPNASIVTISHEHEHHSFTSGVGGEPRVINGPGEYEILDVLINGVRTVSPVGPTQKRLSLNGDGTGDGVDDSSTSDEADHQAAGLHEVAQPEKGGDTAQTAAADPDKTPKLNTAYVIDVDGLRVCHLGDLAGKLTDEQIEEMGSIDVLLVPIGGGDVITPMQAAEVVSQLEPNMVVPMHYQIPGTKSDSLAPVDRFMREMGSKSIEPVPKVSLGARGSLPVDLQVVVLEHKK